MQHVFSLSQLSGHPIPHLFCGLSEEVLGHSNLRPAATMTMNLLLATGKYCGTEGRELSSYILLTSGLSNAFLCFLTLSKSPKKNYTKFTISKDSP